MASLSTCALILECITLTEAAPAFVPSVQRLFRVPPTFLLEVRALVVTLSKGYDLRPREWEALNLIVEGLTDKEMALQMGVSLPSVHKYVIGILKKMDGMSRTHVAVKAVREGLVA